MDRMRPRRSYYFLAVAILPFLFFVQNPTISKSLQQASLNILGPLFSAGKSLESELVNTLGNFKRVMQSYEDQVRYEMRIAQLETKLLRYQELEKENERFKKLLDFSSQVEQKTIAARVIGWDPSPWRKTIVLDKGSNQGIVKDMPVVIDQGLIGRIVEVSAATSRVLLLMDPDARVSAMAEESRAKGVVGGVGARNYQMTYLELDSGIEMGEMILTSGVGQIFPKGIPIGKVIALGKAPDGLHLAAKVEPFVDFTKIEEVLCIKA